MKQLWHFVILQHRLPLLIIGQCAQAWLLVGGGWVGVGGMRRYIYRIIRFVVPFFYHDVVLKKGNIFMEYLWHLVIFGNDACLYFKAMYTHFASSGRGVGGGGRSAAIHTGAEASVRF